MKKWMPEIVFTCFFGLIITGMVTNMLCPSKAKEAGLIKMPYVVWNIFDDSIPPRPHPERNDTIIQPGPWEYERLGRWYKGMMQPKPVYNPYTKMWAAYCGKGRAYLPGPGFLTSGMSPLATEDIYMQVGTRDDKRPYIYATVPVGLETTFPDSLQAQAVIDAWLRNFYFYKRFYDADMDWHKRYGDQSDSIAKLKYKYNLK